MKDVSSRGAYAPDEKIVGTPLAICKINLMIDAKSKWKMVRRIFSYNLWFEYKV